MRTLVFPFLKRPWLLALAVLFGLATGPSIADSNVLFTGGGFIKEGGGADARRIGFSVNLFVDGSGVTMGHLQFYFHNVDDRYGLDRSRFTVSEFSNVQFVTRYFEGTPHTFVRIEATGRLDGMDGWSVLARFTDFGVPVRDSSLPPTHADALRLMLFAPGGVEPFYDTARLTTDGQTEDFAREQSWRTLLDGGNVAVDMKLAP